MSLYRLIYYGAIVGGWAALIGWLAAEWLLGRLGGSADSAWAVPFYGAMVGAAIGAGLNLLAGMANGQLAQQAKRLGPGLIGGAIGGAVGAFAGNWLYTSMGLPRVLGWLVMGIGIGVVEGLYDRSLTKIRNGLMGGAIGGAVGGLLFDVIVRLIGNQREMSGRALGYVVLGLCIGVLIAVVQVVLKRAWLSVVDGYRPKRELILSEPIIVLGRSERLPLPFFGAPSKHVEPEHARLVRERDGRYRLEDLGSKIGTILNKKVIDGPTLLRDGDLIRLGNNVIRFHQSQRSGGARVATAEYDDGPIEFLVDLGGDPEPSPAAIPPTTNGSSRPAPGPVAARPTTPAPPRPAAAPAPPRPTAPAPPRPAAPAPPRPAAPAPPTARPAPPATPRPAAPPIASPPATAPAAAATPPRPANSASCPGCGRFVPGPAGKRYCPSCHQRF